MKKIKIEKTKITKDQLLRDGDKKEVDYKALMELTLDIVPREGFTPKDIRDRNRIQNAIDKAKDCTVSLEDADFENFVTILEGSRWPIRDKELAAFLEKFEKK